MTARMEPRLFSRKVAVAWALAGVCTASPADDPLESAACRRALDALQAQQTALAARRPANEPGQGAAPARLEALRRDAARTCLGGRAAVPAPQRLAQPPVTVPSITVNPPQLPPAPAPAAPLPTPSQGVVGPPLRVIACDATGCWASDGSRLLRAGPSLLGPRGLCSVQGTALRCP